MFIDRKDAGIKLSLKLEKFRNDDSIILAIPRGGIVTAYQTIKEYKFKWDLIIPRKIGSPQNKEVAIGAVTSDGIYLLNEEYVATLNISQEYIENEAFEQVDEIKRRLKKYKGNEKFPEVKDKTVIIIDDGIATGFTILAAIKSVKEHGAKKIVLAVPVAPRDTISHLEAFVDEVICLLIPDQFYAVGSYYENFEQTTDEEVINMANELQKKYSL
ncbi:MAG: phosphoribosyltransferase [Firmicutes bacterium]|nr:phosphoribosyltransferase [Bacillota bacterium]